jgi:hypothetical protein
MGKPIKKFFISVLGATIATVFGYFIIKFIERTPVKANVVAILPNKDADTSIAQQPNNTEIANSQPKQNESVEVQKTTTWPPPKGETDESSLQQSYNSSAYTANKFVAKNKNRSRNTGGWDDNATEKSSYKKDRPHNTWTQDGGNVPKAWKATNSWSSSNETQEEDVPPNNQYAQKDKLTTYLEQRLQQSDMSESSRQLMNRLREISQDCYYKCTPVQSCCSSITIIQNGTTIYNNVVSNNETISFGSYIIYNGRVTKRKNSWNP